MVLNILHLDGLIAIYQTYFSIYISVYIDINQHKSDTIPISIGVPQGVNLRPLLFITSLQYQ